MRRFFCSSREINSGKAVISSIERVHHIRDVLRMRAGNGIIIFDECGNEYECVIEKESPEMIILSVVRKYSCRSEGKRKFTIAVACALAKKSAMDDIVDRLTQLGVDRIFPLITQRVISRPDKQSLLRKWQRWEKIALSAAQQSGRNCLPVVERAVDFSGLLSMTVDYELKLIPTLEGERRHISEFVSAPTDAGSLVFLIGPEGDFTPSETQKARDAGFIPVSLGKLVLRVDTAATAVAGFFHLLGRSQD
jgi:16S rRNA (uracil1498-N3)-methyltransferase